MSFDWKTLAFELINFAVLMALLGRFLFRPARKVMQARKEEIERSQKEVAEARERADAAAREFEARRRELEATADAAAAAARARGEQEAAAVVEAARQESRRLVEGSAAEAEGLRRRVLVELRPQVARLAGEAAARLLREFGGAPLALAFARRGAEVLRERLSPRPSATPIRAWLSPDADEAAVLRELREVLGAGAAIEALRDDALVAGVRLSAGGLEIDASAGAALSAWLAEDGAPPAEAA